MCREKGDNSYLYSDLGRIQRGKILTGFVGGCCVSCVHIHVLQNVLRRCTESLRLLCCDCTERHGLTLVSSKRLWRRNENRRSPNLCVSWTPRKSSFSQKIGDTSAEKLKKLKKVAFFINSDGLESLSSERRWYFFSLNLQVHEELRGEMQLFSIWSTSALLSQKFFFFFLVFFSSRPPNNIFLVSC